MTDSNQIQPSDEHQGAFEDTPPAIKVTGSEEIPATDAEAEEKEPFFKRVRNSLRLHWVFYLIVALGLVLDIGTKKISFAVVDPPVRLYVFKKVEDRKIMVPAKPDEPHRFPAIPGNTPDERITRTVIPGFLNVRCSYNPGAMFGIFPTEVPFLILFTTIAVAVMLGIVHHILKPKQLAMHLALGMICAGALGNLWDRFHFHAVRDFLDFHLGFWPSLAKRLESIGWIGQSHWPTFNVADIFICIGVALVFIKQVIASEGQKLAKQEESATIVQAEDSSGEDDSCDTVTYMQLFGREDFKPGEDVSESALASDEDDSCATVHYDQLYGKDFDPAKDTPEHSATEEEISDAPEPFPRILGKGDVANPDEGNGAPPEERP
ncbi:MAG: signal peptidase II [Planctomycetota bacterium]